MGYFPKRRYSKYPAALDDPKLATGGWDDVSFLVIPIGIFSFCGCKLKSTHDDREIEFIQFKRWLQRLYDMAQNGDGGHSDTALLELDYKSREMIADELCLEIRKRYGSKRDIQIEVSEDNENGWPRSILSTIKMTIYIVDIEAVDTRYTKQWKEHPHN